MNTNHGLKKFRFHWKMHISLILFDTFLPIVYTKKRRNTQMEATEYDAFFVTVLKSLRFHLVTLENGAYSERCVVKTLLFQKPPFPSAFSGVLVWMIGEKKECVFLLCRRLRLELKRLSCINYLIFATDFHFQEIFRFLETPTSCQTKLHLLLKCQKISRTFCGF